MRRARLDEASIARVVGRCLALLTVLGLSACDDAGSDSARESENTSESMASQIPAAFRSGPHGGHDPHAGLSPDKRVQVALQHHAEGRTALAMDTLNQAIELHPDNPALFGVRGSLLLELGRSADALADLNRAVSLDPYDPGLLTNRAQALRSFDRMKEALADLDRAIELDGAFVAARFNRGSMTFDAGEFSRALADFDACIAVDPHAAAPYFNRAAVHEAMGNRELAIGDLQRFLQVASSDTWKQAAVELLQQWGVPDETTAPADQS